MSTWSGISGVLEQITWMGVALGIVGYFIFREWGRRRESMAMLDRMSPEQLADIRRVDAEIEIERRRRSAGNLWFLRIGMAIFGGGLGAFLGLTFLDPSMEKVHNASMNIYSCQLLAFIVMMIGLFIFLEFLIELWLRRMNDAPRRETQK